MKKKKSKKWLIASGLTLAFVVLFMILYVLSALSGLRFFIPNYFTIAGTPFDSKSYLLVLQNNNELRPAGGKIMAYGSVSFNNGLFSDIEVNNLDESITDHEYIDPPYPIENGYTFFDANYDADFKNTANELLTMYKITNPDADFDGVVALNVDVLKDILDIIGNVNIDGELVNSSNIFEKLENSDNETLRDISKNIISKSFRSLLSWRDLSDMFVRNFNEKHIQLYVFNENFSEKLEAKGWSGTWPTNFKGDFIASVEANLGKNQINKYINRSLDYRLYLCDPELDDFCDYTGKIVYTIEHIDRSPEAENYNGYIRFYFPEKTELKSANAQIHYEENAKYKVFGTAINLSPGERKTIEITAELPEDIFDQEVYSLYIPKQSGTIGDSYSVIIETPNGTEIESKSFDIHENIASWKGALLKDKTLSLSVTKPS
jgi:uncharacterized protein DUF4012